MVVVEDERHLAELLTLWFGNHGWHVITAGSGPEGLATTIANDPDIVILDVLLPGYNGLEVLRRLRATGTTVPVILTTALDDLADPDLRDLAGAQVRLTKPYSLAVLEERVMALCGHADHQPAPAQ